MAGQSHKCFLTPRACAKNSLREPPRCSPLGVRLLLERGQLELSPVAMPRLRLIAALLFTSMLTLSACSIGRRESPPAPTQRAVEGVRKPKALGLKTQKGIASLYASSFDGKRTASGEIFRNDKLTAAHRSLPFGTKVRVRSLGNGNTVTVRINDRGPFVRGRIIDLSLAAAKQLGFVDDGLAKVELEILGDS